MRVRRRDIRYQLHLAGRFFGMITAAPLSPREQSEVASLLSPDLAPLFWRQPSADQRHALNVARRVMERDHSDAELIVAALVHDVGKADAGLGPVRRSIATVLDIAGVQVGGRMGRYLDHGAIGARALESAGASDLTVSFARLHPGGPPSGVDPERWKLLLDADG